MQQIKKQDKRKLEPFKYNNFDLIRLIAALEVAITHSLSHLNTDLASVSAVLLYIPGVPVFFFVSGFLISKSFENSDSINNYGINRVLRIYPGLILVTVIGILSVYLSGYFSTIDVSIDQIFVWFLGQATIVQFYNPNFMREFGVGVLNGSLWTICIELQFYILTPLMYLLFRLDKSRKNDKWIYVTIAVSMIIHFTYYNFKPTMGEVFFLKLLSVTFIPWFYMFLIGVVFQRNFEYLYKVFHDKLFYVLVTYIAMVLLTGWRMGNGINPLIFMTLAILVFTLAYACPDFSNRVLKGNDISYGIYIYHMIFVNLFLYYGLSENFFYVSIVVMLSIGAGLVSWIYFEKPILKLKKKSIHKIS